MPRSRNPLAICARQTALAADDRGVISPKPVVVIVDTVKYTESSLDSGSL